MRQSFRRSLFLAVGALLLPVAASAQVLTFATQFTGEVPVADQKLFRDALAAEASSIWKGGAKTEAETAALLGAGAACSDASCATAAGAAVPASAAISARINDEAEIFDFTVSVFSAVDGKLLVKESGECTFCSMQEASVAFRATAKTALGKVGTLPTATAGKVVAPAPVIAAAPVVVAAPDAEEAAPEAEVELLPFKLDGQTYIRPSAAGNWASGDLWYTNADGSKGAYFGELMEDGSINTDAEEPSFD